MASITDLAAMYRQRIPTTTTTGKTGPRQTTVDDVRRVATYGRSAMTPSSMTLKPGVGTFQYTPAQLETIQSGIVGGPGAGYGLKYGGFSTQAQQNTAIEAEAFATRELAALARQKAEQEISKNADEYIDPIMPELSRSASMAGVRPGALMSEADRAKLMGGYKTVQEFGRTPEYQLAREQGQVQGYTPNDLMRIAYESMLGAPQMSAEQRRIAADIAQQQGVNLPSVGRYGQLLQTPEIAAPRELAETIANTPVSEYARQIAQARYGMDPNLAAGLFGPKMDMDYAKEQDDYDRFNRGYTERSMTEIIFDTYGQEGLNQYRQKLADEAMFGSENEQRSAIDQQIEDENLATDLDIEANYGFRPSMVPGADADTVRQAFFDPNFQDAVDLAVKGFQDGGLDPNEADNIIRNYLEASGGSMSAPVNAQILESIIATFDTTYFDFG
jgi:hypothetical protein